MMYEYNGFTATIKQGSNKWAGIIFGLEIRFEAESEETCIRRFHEIVDENLPDPD